MVMSSEEKHTTIGGIAGIIHQFYVFLYLEIANKYDIPVIEDAAEGFSSRWRCRSDT